MTANLLVATLAARVARGAAVPIVGHMVVARTAGLAILGAVADALVAFFVFFIFRGKTFRTLSYIIQKYKKRPSCDGLLVLLSQSMRLAMRLVAHALDFAACVLTGQVVSPHSGQA
jgi:hypothetical protein